MNKPHWKISSLGALRVLLLQYQYQRLLNAKWWRQGGRGAQRGRNSTLKPPLLRAHTRAPSPTLTPETQDTGLGFEIQL